MPAFAAKEVIRASGTTKSPKPYAVNGESRKTEEIENADHVSNHRSPVCTEAEDYKAAYEPSRQGKER